MPVANVQNAREVQRSLQTALTIKDVDARGQVIRSLLVETLDFERDDATPSGCDGQCHIDLGE